MHTTIPRRLSHKEIMLVAYADYHLFSHTHRACSTEMATGKFPQAQQRRSRAACLRCRHHRIKCDFEMPKCSNCEMMSAKCEILHPSTGNVIPRNYIEELENRALNIERDLSIIARISPPVSDESDISLWGPSSGLQLAHRIYLRFCSVISIGEHENEQRALLEFEAHRIETQQSGVSFPTLPPKNVMEDAIISFFDSFYPYFPIMSCEELIGTHYIPIYGYPGPLILSKYPRLASSFERMASGFADTHPTLLESGAFVEPAEPHLRGSLYFLLEVMAIFHSADLEQPQKCEKYHLHAMTCFYELFSLSDISHALISLLFYGLYSLCRPSFPGAWQLNGIITNMCIEQGLHRSDGLSDHQRRVISESKRRQVLCCCVIFDKLVSSILGRPSAMSGFDIDAPFFATEEKSAIGIGNNKQRISKNATRLLLEILTIQEDIKTSLYDKIGIFRPQGDVAIQLRTEWMKKLELWLDSYSYSQKNGIDARLNFAKIFYCNSILLLAGFSLETSETDDSELPVVLSACESIIEVYSSLHNHRRLFLSWTGVNHLTFAASTGLFTLWRLFRIGMLAFDHIRRWGILLNDCLALNKHLQGAFPAASSCEKLILSNKQMLMSLISSLSLQSYGESDEVPHLTSLAPRSQ